MSALEKAIVSSAEGNTGRSKSKSVVGHFRTLATEASEAPLVTRPDFVKKGGVRRCRSVIFVVEGFHFGFCTK
jgi:hypothetical protein